MKVAQGEGAVSARPYGAPPQKATIILSDRERARLEVKFDDLEARVAHLDLDDSRLLTEVEIAGRMLPPRLMDRLVRFRVAGNQHGTLLIRNLPTGGPLPPTPESGSISSWSTTARSTLTQLAVMSVLGHVIAYADGRRGALIQDICGNEPGDSGLPELRTEDPLHPFKPQVTSYMCLRGGRERMGPTMTASIRLALPLLLEPTVQALRQPIYRIRLITSSAIPDDPTYLFGPMPVLSGPDDEPDLCVDFRTMEAIHPIGAVAFETLRSTLNTVQISVILDSGDMLVVDNRVAAHRQVGSVPRNDGDDPWLRRCFAVADLWPSRGMRNPASRVCRLASG